MPKNVQTTAQLHSSHTLVKEKNSSKQSESVSHSVSDSLVTPWTITHQASLSIEFSRQEYWSRLPFSFPEDLPYPGIEAGSPVLQADSLLWRSIVRKTQEFD